MNRIPLVVVLALVLIAASSTQARAELVLRMTDVEASVSVTIVDNGPLDGDPTLGIVEPIFSGSPYMVGEFEILDGFSGFIASLGGVAETELHVLIHSDLTTSGTFAAELSETGISLGGPISSLYAVVGGTIYPTGLSTVDFTAGFDDNDNPFSYPPATTLSLPALGGSINFGGSGSMPVTGTSPFAISQRSVVHAAADEYISFDANPHAAAEVPEPTSLALWAVASVIGACVVRYRRVAPLTK